MKKNLLLSVLLIVFGLSLKSQCYFGVFPPVGTSGGWTNGVWLARKFTLSSPAVLSGLALNAATNGATPYRMAIYTDASSTPGNFVAATASGIMGAGYNILPVTTPTSIPAGDYWIMAFYNQSNAQTTSFGTTASVKTQVGSMATTPGNLSAWNASTGFGFEYWAIINSPTITVSGATTACSGTQMNLTASGASSYTWSTGASTSSITVSASTNTTYFAAGTGTNGCYGFSNTLTLNVFPSPTISISSSATLCSGASTTLTASGATSYIWSTGPQSHSIVVSPTSNVTYSVIGSDNNGCTGAASQAVTVNPNPVVTVTGNNTVCAGQSTTITATGANSYSWSSGQTVPSVTLTPTTNSAYVVTGTDNVGCTDSKTVILVVNALPNINVQGNTAACATASGTLLASGASTYTWNGSATGNSLTFTVNANTTYTVEGTDVNGCKNTGLATVTVNALPNLTVSSSAPVLCQGQNAVINISGVVSSSLNTGASGLQITVTPSITTTYTVTGTDNNNCTSSTVFTQTVQVCTGLNAIENSSDVVVFPNPGKGNFAVKLGTSSMASVEVYDIRGLLICRQAVESGETTLNLAGYASGIYYLVVQSETAKSVAKLIIE